mmetsp:Transcript_38486/g.86385  ORF Transcript_38486/g.86385 Transcript_38486/m.86385 type:complete len:112 (+) Transcript_38486:3-338(+)
MFQLFDNDGDGTVDIREFVLGMCNFTNMERDKRVRFIFEVFDEDRSGFLSLAELVAVLKANHLQSQPDAVRRKAETIMKQTDKDGSGTLTLDEFLVVSKKFPNILFPTTIQ